MADIGTIDTGTGVSRLRGPVLDVVIPAGLLAGAAIGWWWSVRMASDMESMAMGGAATGGMAMSAFVVGWVAMMAAMMFPAIAPMVRLYAQAAAKGNVAPVPFFVLGYLLVWSAIGLPAYFAWREIAAPLEEGAVWVGRLAGITLVAAGIYQLTPLKAMCLTHCRSPISFFLEHGRGATNTPYRAARLGAVHGTFCLGCCWAIMAILVAVGTMHLGWMVLLTAVIIVEKNAPRGETFAAFAAVGFGLAGTVLLAHPASITTLT